MQHHAKVATLAAGLLVLSACDEPAAVGTVDAEPQLAKHGRPPWSSGAITGGDSPYDRHRPDAD